MSSTSIHVRDYRKEIPGGLSTDMMQWSFPRVESINTHGKKTVWTVYVRLFRNDPNIKLPEVPAESFCMIDDQYFNSQPMPQSILGWINVDSGIIGMKVKKSTPTIVHSGKNLGKISATNVLTQALRDAYGLYNKQKKKAAGGQSIDSSVDLYPPMLAQVLKEQKSPPIIDEQHSVYVQPKYNGVRAVSTINAGGVIMYSRRKNIYSAFSYIKDELLEVLSIYWKDSRRLYLDGEIYSHGVPLQDISGYARREDQQSDIKVSYMIYDCFMANEPELIYSDRKKILDEIFDKFKFNYCKKVETFEVFASADIDKLYNTFVSDGFEGAMIRVDAPYIFSYNERHSKVLLKVKPTLDAEFAIVGWETGRKGKAASAIMMICQTEAGTKFPVTPAMDLVERIALAKKMNDIEPNGKNHFENHWYGKPLIVYFDEQSKDMVPQRARTKMEIKTWV